MHPQLEQIRDRTRANTLSDEAEALQRLVAPAGLSDDQRAAISARAADLVRAVRDSSNPQILEAFLSEYGLSTREGVALMCLAEALLRVPDAGTMDDLIRDKIAPQDWSVHSGHSSSNFVNASTWALMLTGRVLEDGGIEGTLRAMIRRLGEPVIRKAVRAAMQEMGEQFVLGRGIEEAMRRGRDFTRKGYFYSFDMLGEQARTEADALNYHRAYTEAIASLAATAAGTDTAKNHGISVKLSALHPRYEAGQKETMLPVMTERLLSLARAAKGGHIGLNIDAEEADRLDLSLDVIERVLSAPELAGWDGFGVVVQAYGPRAAFVIDWLYALAGQVGRRIMVRLVKGAYWDTEIKRAQVMGLDGYPVFTRKPNTDISYIACARKLLGMTDRIYPQFATHNAHTVAAILAMAEDKESFEFQRLHGMGEALHEVVRRSEGTRCRIYAPGRRAFGPACLSGAPAARKRRQLVLRAPDRRQDHRRRDDRAGSVRESRRARTGGQSGDPSSRRYLRRAARQLPRLRSHRSPHARKDRDRAKAVRRAASLEGRADAGRRHRPSSSTRRDQPRRPQEIVGDVIEADAADVTTAMDAAVKAQVRWENTPVATRAEILLAAAELYEQNAVEFFALCAREAGKTLADGVAELREAVDLLRYYAGQAVRAEPDTRARGVIACISPWNFPLAIFTGQIAAALVTGNAVVAKPAEQTPADRRARRRPAARCGDPE